MTLAKRVRDCRYAKGWGPDELAGRAQISRTALYQIECGKTELPRAGTLRRIARALEVPVDTLLGEAEAVAFHADPFATGRAEPAPVPSPGRFVGARLADEEAFAEGGTTTARERDLTRKFQELLASPLGDGIARIVEEMHRLLPAGLSSRAE